MAKIGDVVAKDALSESTNGKQIVVVATAIGSGTTIHTATAGTDTWDEIWMWAYNSYTAVQQLVVGWGGVVDPNDLMEYTIQPKQEVMISAGKILQNGLDIKMSSTDASKVMIGSFRNILTK